MFKVNAMWREVVNVPVAFSIVVEHMPFRLVRVGGETFAGRVPHAVVGTATAIGLRRDTLNIFRGNALTGADPIAFVKIEGADGLLRLLAINHSLCYNREAVGRIEASKELQEVLLAGVAVLRHKPWCNVTLCVRIEPQPLVGGHLAVELIDAPLPNILPQVGAVGATLQPVEDVELVNLDSDS